MNVDNVYEALADEIKRHHRKFGGYFLIGIERGLVLDYSRCKNCTSRRNEENYLIGFIDFLWTIGYNMYIRN